MTSSCRGAYQPLIGAKGYSRDPKTRCIASSSFALLGLNIPSVESLAVKAPSPSMRTEYPSARLLLSSSTSKLTIPSISALAKVVPRAIRSASSPRFTVPSTSNLGACRRFPRPNCSGNSLMMYLAIRLVLEGNVSQMVGQIPFFRSPSQQKQTAFTAEGASTYFRKPQHLHEKAIASTGEDESRDSRRRPALDSQKYATYCKKPIKCPMKN